MPEKQILIVDDEIHVAETIQKWLVSSDYAEITIATTGRSAVQKALEMQPGLILMDVRLGDDIDGVEAAEEILKHLDVPIIYMTAYLDEEIVQRAKITEPFGYLLKPFEGRDLEIAIEMALYKHKMQRKLKANHQWLAATLRSIGDGVITTDTEGNINFMNPVAEALTGWKQAEVFGKPLPQIFKIMGKEIGDSAKAPLENNILLTRNGKEISIDHTIAPIVDDYGQITGSVLVLRDTTERKHYEEALRLSEERYRQRNNELALLNNVSQAFISTLNLDQVLTSVLDEVRNLLDVVACSAWLVDRETGGLVCRQVTDPQGQIVRGWRLAPGEGIAGWVAQQGTSLLVSDTQKDPRHYKQVDQKTGLEIRSILTVPLRVNRTIIGVLQAVDKTINRFAETDLALLESLAATAAIAIENARLYEQTRRDAETKATLLREVNHRVKNNLAAIIGLLYAEQQYPRLKNGEAYQHFIRALINRIHGLATAHHLLSEAQWLPLPISSLIEQIISSALQALPLDKYVSVVVSPSLVRIGPKQANDLALVINELTTNTMKYGLLERQTARIEVHIVQEGEVIQLQFRDDGPGYAEAVLQGKQHNVGIYLIQTMVSRGLEGEVTFHNDQGAVTNIRFRVIS
jgi:PAS domain S-box-containing protein